MLYVSPVIREKGLKHASELNKGGGVKLRKMAGRSLDFPLFYTDNASEAVHLQIILLDSGMYIGDNHTKLRIQQQAVQTKLRYS